MENKAKEINMNEMEQVTGGSVRVPGSFCSHAEKEQTGLKKEENGVAYLQFKCKKCNALIWVKLSDLFSTAIEV